MSNRWIFSTTIFLNAMLLFWVQPLVGKMILPLAGGAPAVWNTCLFFFQGTLLAGYVYAHVGSAGLGSRRHGALHLILVLAAVGLLPMAFGKDALADLERYPAWAILRALIANVGFPFFIISAGSPLLQKWFAGTGDQDAADPYFLYAASNLGSFVGLIAYPVLLEPFLTLGEQNRIWFLGYTVLVVLLVLCAWPVLRGERVAPAPAATAVELPSEPVTSLRRLRWLLWSFAPSSLLLGVTTYITTDVASVPLFWIVPLSLYLLSFVLAFARPRWAVHPFAVRIQALLVCVSTINYFAEAIAHPWLVVGLHLLTFLATAVVCHGRLADDRPPAGYLTEFYLWLSLGGMLGGLFNSLIAPRIFLRLEEYPLVIIIAVFLRPYLVKDRAEAKFNPWDVVLPLALGCAYYYLDYAFRTISGWPDELKSPLLFGLAAFACIHFARRPLRFGLALLALFVVTLVEPDTGSTTLFRGRSFFGVYRVRLNGDGTRVSLLHGTTLHGTQNLDAKLRTTPISYYFPSGPIGQIFQSFAQSRANANIGLVGLGSGGLACYAKPGQRFTFFEIDPLIERIARDPKLFTYLRDCPAELAITIGDARVSLAMTPKRHFTLLVLDAFSSDAIPIHLLTLEALQLYFDKLADDGIVAIHISNRYLDLEPVLGRLAKELQLAALIRSDDDRSEEEIEQGKFSSTWVVLSRAQSSLKAFEKDRRWETLEAGPDLWTDSYSNILRVLKRR